MMSGEWNAMNKVLMGRPRQFKRFISGEFVFIYRDPLHCRSWSED